MGCSRHQHWRGVAVEGNCQKWVFGIFSSTSLYFPLRAVQPASARPYVTDTRRPPNVGPLTTAAHMRWPAPPGGWQTWDLPYKAGADSLTAA